MPEPHYLYQSLIIYTRASFFIPEPHVLLVDVETAGKEIFDLSNGGPSTERRLGRKRLTNLSKSKHTY
jgi:hypothetical protein